MKDLNFKYASAKNFLCFGSEGIEIDFTKFGNIVLIRGTNLDVTSEEEKIASNGTGKSSLIEIVVYGLFGKTIKHPKKLTHKDVINKKNGKNLRVEVCWDNFKVIRERAPDSLHLWEEKNGVWDEISQGGMPAIQKQIEDKLGLNYEGFVNIVVFTDNNAGCFLELDTPSRREIVENLLSLEKYRLYGEKAKKQRKKITDKIKNAAEKYERVTNEILVIKKRLESIRQQETQWINTKKQEIAVLTKNIESKKQELVNTDAGKLLAVYQDAQNKIKSNNDEISQIETNQLKLHEFSSEADKKLVDKKKVREEHAIKVQQITRTISELTNEISISNKTIARLNNLDKGAKCNNCLGLIDESNFESTITVEQSKVDVCNASILLENEKKVPLLSEIEGLDVEIKKLSDGILTAKKRINDNAAKITNFRNEILKLSKVEKPEISANEKVIQEQINTWEKQILDKNNELSNSNPYVQLFTDTEGELSNKQKEAVIDKDELKKIEAELPYFEVWVKGFGDSGIRKLVIDGIIPALNARMTFWLQFLIDNKIRLEFDNELNSTISRVPADGDPFVYYAVSGGEKRRLNLAVSQSFAHIKSLNSGTCPSLLFLDEVATNIDIIGVEGVYNMIQELARKGRKVFITTHDHGLLNLLTGCETISLVKENGFTTIES